MRPAQRALARALPKPKPGLRMVQATVVQPWTTASTVGPLPLFSDSFNRQDGAIGDTDGGTGGIRQWAFDTYAGYEWSVASDAATTLAAVPGPNPGSYAACSINSEHQGGTTQATIARVGAGAMGIHVRAASFLGYQFYLVAVPGQGYTKGPGIILGSPPAVGDLLQIEDTLDQIIYYVNDVALAVDDDRYLGSAGWAATLSDYYVGMLSDTSVISGMGLRDWSYTAPGTTQSVTPGADIEVDFGDGVAVACPRASNCPPVEVGDLVLVMRQHHSNIVVDKITPLGDS